MSTTATLPRLTTAQRTVLAEMPPIGPRTARAYGKLADPDLRLVVKFADAYQRTDEGDRVLAALRNEGLVPEAEDNEGREAEAAVLEPEPEPEPAAEPAKRSRKPKTAAYKYVRIGVGHPDAQAIAQLRTERRSARTSANPNYPGEGLVRTCKYRDHEGTNPLPFEDDTHFPVRKGGERAGSAVGWCRDCCAKYRHAKSEGTFVPKQTRTTSASPRVRQTREEAAYEQLAPEAFSGDLTDLVSDFGVPAAA